MFLHSKEMSNLSKFNKFPKKIIYPKTYKQSTRLFLKYQIHMQPKDFSKFILYNEPLNQFNSSK